MMFASFIFMSTGQFKDHVYLSIKTIILIGVRYKLCFKIILVSK